MEPKEYIAAIDLGSSKIVGMIGWKRPDATLEVVAVEKIDSQTCIRRGNIHNLEETTNNVKQILQKLDARIQPNKLLRVYVGVSGQSIHTLNHQVSRTFANEEFVNEKIIESIIDECYDYAVDENIEVLEVIPNEYKLDAKKTEINPVGVACEEIEANVRLIVGRSSLKRNISRAIEDKTNIDVCGMPIAQMSSASLLLSDADKILGCALIDFGAGTTSVTIYKDGLLRHLAVIPFGGNVVTKDICSANLLEVDAEKLKTSFGSAIFNPDADNKVFKPRNLGTIDEPSIELHTLNNIIEARMTEIVQNVWAQIENSGFGKSLGAGIYYTGGASQLRNLGDLIKNITGIEAKKSATNRSIFNSSASSETMQNPAYSVVLGILSSGLKNCVKVHHVPATVSVLDFSTEDEPIVESVVSRKPEEKKEKEEKKGKAPKPPKPPSEGTWNKLGKKIKEMSGTLFSESSDDDDTHEMK
ncbi:MAG: cell division protein FtsA [Bacteroidales bacterium]